MSTIDTLVDEALESASDRIRDGTLQVTREVRDYWEHYFNTRASGLAGAGILKRRAKPRITARWAPAGRPGSQARNNSVARLAVLADTILIQVIESHIATGSSPETTPAQSF